MNAEPELYLREALADEEPRYLRRQKPLEIRRRRFGPRHWPAYRRWLLVSVGVLAGSCLAYAGFRFFLFSPRLEFTGYEQIEISGSRHVPLAAVTKVFAPDLGKSILRMPLDARRSALAGITWVEKASVERVLPDRVRVHLTERTPVAFLRTGHALALVDAHGVILEKPTEGNFAFPVVSGLSEAMPLPDREQRMRMFVQFLKDIDLVRSGASDQVSEVDLSDPEDVRATLAGLAGFERQVPLVVRFGDSDFVNKYRLLIENLGHWQTSAGRVESVDLRFSRQVVVNSESERTARAASPGGPAAERSGNARAR